MDLNRLRKLAGLDEIKDTITEAEKIKKGAFHRWLGKSEDEPITNADIERGLASNDEHVKKMAQFAKNMQHIHESDDNLYNQGHQFGVSSAKSGIGRKEFDDKLHNHSRYKMGGTIATAFGRGAMDGWLETREGDHLEESAPADEEKFIKDNKKEFKKRYGKRWEAVLYATAWKMHNKKDSVKESLNEDKVVKGAFHKWLGKPEDEKITQADIEKGLASNDEHVRKMAQYAKNVKESFYIADEFDAYLLKEDAPKMHHLSYKCPECKHEWEIDAKVHRDDECPECGKVSLPKKDITEAEKPNDSEFPKITFLGKEAANKLNLTNVEFNDDTMEYNKSKFGVDVEQSTKKVTPANVKKNIDKRIKELENAIELYDEKGYDEKSMKSTAVDVLKKFKEHLDKENIQEFKMAQVYYGTLMGPLLDLLPSQLVNFLHDGREEIKKSIK